MIYNKDCLKNLHLVKDVNLIITDPPFTDYHTDLYKQTPIDFLKKFNCRQFVFWSAKSEFPLSYTAIHIWDKMVGVGSMYERIFERNGGKNYRVFNANLINNKVTGEMNMDTFTGHPSQKPKKLIYKLIFDYSKEGDLIYDPFMGTGVVGVCCKMLNRRYIGFEIDKKWFEIAKERIDKTNCVNLSKWFGGEK